MQEQSQEEAKANVLPGPSLSDVPLGDDEGRDHSDDGNDSEHQQQKNIQKSRSQDAAAVEEEEDAVVREAQHHKQQNDQEHYEQQEEQPPKYLRFNQDALDYSDVDDDDDDMDIDQNKQSRCCRARTLCTILTILLILLSCTAAGMAVFATTRFYSLVVFVPLISISLLSCVAVMCHISATEEVQVENEVVLPIVIDPSASLPEPVLTGKKKRKFRRRKRKKVYVVKTKTKSRDDNEDDDDLDHEGHLKNSKSIQNSKSNSSSLDYTIRTASFSDEAEEEHTQRDIERQGTGQGFMATTFPEIHRTIENTQRAFEDATDYIIARLFRPATAICRPATAPRCASADGSLSHISQVRSRSGFSRSGFVVEPDVECCTDMHCFRDENGAINLSGTYKLVHNDNFDGFLKAIKVPALLRRAAVATRPMHVYTHNTHEGTFRVQIEGIVKGDTTFVIAGTPTISSMRHLKFLDHVSYMEGKDGIVVRKVLQNRPKNFTTEDTAEIIVNRELSLNGKKMILTSVAIGGDGNIIAKSIQTFLRM